MKRKLFCLAALLLLLAVLSGCEARELPRDAVTGLIDDLRAGKIESIAETIDHPDAILPLLDPDAPDPMMRRYTKAVLNGLTYEVGDMRGTYDATRVVITLENRDLAVVTAAFTQALVADEAEAQTADVTELTALFENACENTEAVVSQELVLTMNFNVSANCWVFSVPDEFWSAVLGGDPSLLSALQ